jgi:hypothetical protein
MNPPDIDPNSPNWFAAPEDEPGHTHSRQINTALLTATDTFVAPVGRSTSGVAPASIPYYNVKDYGAVGNGSNDDSTAINAAITAAAINGAQVVIPPGNYKLVASAVVPQTGVDIIGSGWGKTILLPYGIISGLKQENGVANAKIADFEIDCSNQTLTSGSYNVLTKGINMPVCLDTILEHLYVYNSAATAFGFDFPTYCWLVDCLAVNAGRLNGGTNPGGAGFGIGVGNVAEEVAFIIDCVAKGGGRDGLLLEYQDVSTTMPTGYRVINFHAESNGGHGINDAGCNGLQVIGGIMKSNAGSGMACSAGTISSGKPGENGIVTGLDTVSNTINGFHYDCSSVNGIGGYRLLGIKAHSNGHHGILLQPSGTSGSNISDMAVEHCAAFLNARSGIALSSGNGGTGSGINRPYITNNQCSDNGSSASTPDGILINANLVDAHIQNNRCWDDQGSPTQTSGIIINSGITLSGFGEITRNDVRSSSGSGIVTSGATINTTVLVKDNPGYNPIGVLTVAVPLTTVAVAATNGDMDFYVTAGATSVTMAISSGPTITIPALGCVLVRVPAGQTVTPTYTNAPTWVVEGS